jgi:hypothetical protein
VAVLEDAELAKISPKLTLERLKLVVLELAMLFDATDSSAAAALRPVSDV